MDLGVCGQLQVKLGSGLSLSLSLSLREREREPIPPQMGELRPTSCVRERCERPSWTQATRNRWSGSWPAEREASGSLGLPAKPLASRPPASASLRVCLPLPLIWCHLFACAGFAAMVWFDFGFGFGFGFGCCGHTQAHWDSPDHADATAAASSSAGSSSRASGSN